MKSNIFKVPEQNFSYIFSTYLNTKINLNIQVYKLVSIKQLSKIYLEATYAII